MKTTSQESIFTIVAASAELLVDLQSDQHPTVVTAWNSSILRLENCGSHFGFVQSGQATLATQRGHFTLAEGMYFCVPGSVEICGSGSGFVATRIGCRGFFQVGGPVEETGRLQYIDGCRDSLLISPIVYGDPCLNFLHVPPETDQTAHTHPSLRVGMIVNGEGICRTSDYDVPLIPGGVFVIRAGGVHSFHTNSHSLRIVAWHPDSDFGPTDKVHPMINRSFVNGRPITAAGETK
jgi:hypothetical protein